MIDSRDSLEAIRKISNGTVTHMNETTSILASSANDAKRTQNRFAFPCPACNSIMEAVGADWCLCMVKRPSVVCDSCHTCLCKAAPRINREFWSLAPASVIEDNEAERYMRAGQTTVDGHIVDVLIVDDDEEIRSVAAYVIQEMGYSVLTAAGAAEALKLMQTVRPALVLTDALMPKIDGRQLCRMIKTGFPRVAVVIMTALYTSPRYKYEALKTFRADGYVAKPIDFARLTEVIGQLVPRRMEIAGRQGGRDARMAA